MVDYEKKIKGQPEKETQIKELKNTPPLSLWGDQRMNPLFLKVAEFFGVDYREYPRAESKLVSILDWAMRSSKSKQSGEIIKKIAETSKGLQSAGFSEKPYAVLYRYIKLANQEADIKKEMGAYKK
jgi:hypothetical protein